MYKLLQNRLGRLKLLSLLLIMIISFVNIAAIQRRGFYFCPGNSEAEIPFELIKNLVVFKAKINGYDFNLAFDTGTTSLIISHKSLNNINGLQKGKALKFSGIGNGRRLNSYLVHDLSIELPGISGRNITAAVIKNSRGIFKKLSIDGIIGYDLLIRFITHIDYDKRVIRFIQPASFQSPKHYLTHPIKIKNSKPYLYAEIIHNASTREKACLLIDTGAQSGLLLEQKQSNMHMRTNQIALLKGLSGYVYGFKDDIESLQIGFLKLHDQSVMFLERGWFGENNHDDRRGSIGQDVLNKFNLILDYFNQKIYLKPYNMELDVNHKPKGFSKNFNRKTKILNQD